ncbi:patatin-like phospholipase family protein [Nitratidesulfovibrio sp. SRB-5]|uniref:patatin-like phospholipase family protein n=1 Tax=Nitratidesulfovibrio sp. SRB-5 TaxID=2872636 RepID=UPI001CBA5F12|nr:patatin-like phospholipase family protein [Nitratidesulfovibrio sp. SRB-5]
MADGQDAGGGKAVSLYCNVVFKGGGIKGVAYAGALRALARHGLLRGVRRVAGTSSGAMAAVFLALGASPDEMVDILLRTPFHKFMDASRWVGGDLQRLVRDFGWFKGEMLERWARANIAALTGNPHMTFAGHQRMVEADPGRYLELTIIGANLSIQTPELFNAERTPEVPIHEALRVSMSIPLFFKAVRNHKGELLVDGSVVWNYPISLYDRVRYVVPGAAREVHPESRDEDAVVLNRETLGLMVETRSANEGIVRESGQITDFRTYLRSIIGFMTDSMHSAYLSEADWKRTALIDALGIRSTDFHIGKDVVESLISSGDRCIEAFIASGKHC